MSGNSGSDYSLFDLREVERTRLFVIDGDTVFVDDFLALPLEDKTLQELFLDLNVDIGFSDNDQEKVQGKLAKICAVLLFVALRFNRFTFFKKLLKEYGNVPKVQRTLDIATLADAEGKNLMIYAVEYLTIWQECQEALQLLEVAGCDPGCVAKGGYTILHAAVHTLKPELVKWCLNVRKMKLTDFMPAVSSDCILSGLHLLRETKTPMLDAPVEAISWAMVGGSKLLANAKSAEDVAARIGIFDRLMEVLNYCGGFGAFKTQDELLLLLNCVWTLEWVVGCDIKSLLACAAPQAPDTEGFDDEHDEPREEQKSSIENLAGLITIFRELITARELTLDLELKVAVKVAKMLDELLLKPVVVGRVVFFLIAHDAVSLLRWLIAYKPQVVKRCLGNFGTKILMVAACNGRVDMVRTLLEVVDINENIDGYTAFMLASAVGSVLVVRDFLQMMAGAGEEFCAKVMGATDTSGRNAFMLAAMNNRVSVIKEFMTVFGAGHE